MFNCDDCNQPTYTVFDIGDGVYCGCCYDKRVKVKK